MDQPIIEILFLLFLILLNGFFAMAEFAIISSRRSRLQQLAEDGNPRAVTALELASKPDTFLATVQVGITLIGILSGAVGGATLAHILAAWFATFAWLAPYAGSLSVTIVVLILTFLSLLLGELVPKQLALHSAEPIALALAGTMKFLSKLASPIVRSLSACSNLIIRLLGVHPSAEPPVTEDEINLLMEQGTQAGVFETAEQEMVESVLKLGEQRAGAIMTPRPQIDWIDLDGSARDDPQTHHRIAAHAISHRARRSG